MDGIYAVYDVFPGSAKQGDCIVRTTIDADNEIQEPDESPTSNIWDRNSTIVK